MIDDYLPETEPSGALVPPPRHPPTAIVPAVAHPPHRPSSAVRSRDLSVRALVEDALDSLDKLGDSIAGAVGLR